MGIIQMVQTEIYLWAARNRLVYDAQIHGLPQPPGMAKKPKLPTPPKRDQPRENYKFVGPNKVRAKVEETANGSNWDMQTNKKLRVKQNGRNPNLHELDERWLLFKFEYKLAESLERQRAKFEEVKVRWADEMSIKDIVRDFLKFEIEFSEASIKKAVWAYNRSHEMQEGTLDQERYPYLP